ncbi:hypothetical protein J8281_10960 [Aquimarina sp. U1-2]|uniref:DUF6146 family protein n=1 Tax=Aquimarina sp. U1-2 TaxID=2823141 RepID=UPI001AED07E6|nr:DUF6146 family protein [Aquimarina sp. U1-2]MBP2832705.1 hypothetical protein [Aquimarina sp. U1-2]
MKTFFIAISVALLIVSCTSTQHKNMNVSSTPNPSDTVRISNDSLEYEIIIIEPGFTSWLVTQRPRGFYSEQFLETRNRLYVNEYNQRVLEPQRFNPNLYIQRIEYEPNIHYGYEVNYLLYHYFLYFEQRYRQNFIMTRGRTF